MESCKPERVLRFCPRCGSEGFGSRAGKSFSCRECGFELYINAAAAVVALIEDDQGRLLLVRRAREPMKGTLDLPGGFVDPGETIEEALRREIREELNLDIESFSYFCSFPNTYPYGGIVYHTIDLTFACTVKDLSRIRTGDDAGEHLFVSPENIRLEDIGLHSIREIASRYIVSKTKKEVQS
ncbi:MAG TPA: NUDIX domain-containing protein [Deltaproteobacteria bacterium]|nr:NUDIX domain-containing protein [Deltaproteobacteria bacterium]HQI00803.1 NUDIX domain-containing protein [Deltaproteobacteria bacterium]HQJ08998.1 NUDIX domain-containing protein [Deltaproteobacteria bacterium]